MKNQVELIGHYGNDLTHCCSAWTSVSRELTEDKLQEERQRKMLNMLAKEGHHTPFEKSMLHFLVTADTASHIHLIKHRIGVCVNGESARYKELKEDKALIPQDWPLQEQERLINHNALCFREYHAAVKWLTEFGGLTRKRAKESARFYLPYSNQLVLDVSFNFRSFMHFQGLRNSEHAQLEIREIAQDMIRQVRETGDFNLSLAAFGYGEEK